MVFKGCATSRAEALIKPCLLSRAKSVNIYKPNALVIISLLRGAKFIARNITKGFV